jgi:hypothetical protein
MDVLQELQMSTTQELNVHAENTSCEIVKIIAENVGLEKEYIKVKQEHDEATQKVE